MKIYILGSNYFMKQMVECKNKLCGLGHEGWIHPDYEALVRGERKEHLDRWASAREGERAALKRENNYFKIHYQHILESDAVLIVNLEKKGTKNYIGGNALIEMGQAYVNNKKIFLLEDIPYDSSFVDEIDAMDPICLHGDLRNIV
jgi:hypothetical protein